VPGVNRSRDVLTQMHIGVPRERKPGECRVSLLPDAVHRLVASGHEVKVERDAAIALGISNESYAVAGAHIVADPASIYATQLVVKVKELQRSEWPELHAGCAIMAFQQLVADADLLAAALAARITCVAYETLEDDAGDLPVLTPMSEIAGMLAPQLAGLALLRGFGMSGATIEGAGILLPTLPGAAPARALVIGAGNSGRAAARLLAQQGASVMVLSRSERQREAVTQSCANSIAFDLCCPDTLDAAIEGVAVVIGAVLVRGARSPQLITRAHLKRMLPGGVFIDIGIDQGGISETSRPSTIKEPFYTEEGILHACVPNLPALVPTSASASLSAAILPFVECIGHHGDVLTAAMHLRGLARGIAVHDGVIRDPRLAQSTARRVHGS
jgi:alanine dehydrogenase